MKMTKDQMPGLRTYEFEMAWGSEGSGKGQFNYPRGIALDSFENIYVTDKLYNRIQKFSPDGKFIDLWDNIKKPIDVAINKKNDIYVLQEEEFGGNITHFHPEKGVINELRIEGIDPEALHVDDDNNIYLAFREKIQKLNSSGVRQWELSKSGPEIYSFSQYGSKKVDNSFWGICGITKDSEGYIIFVDCYKAFKWKEEENWRDDQEHLLRNHPVSWSVPRPNRVAVDRSNCIFVSSSETNLIQKFLPDGTLIRTIGTKPRGLISGLLNKAPQPGELSQPNGMAIDRKGNIFVADSVNHQIKKYKAIPPFSYDTESLVPDQNTTKTNQIVQKPKTSSHLENMGPVTPTFFTKDHSLRKIESPELKTAFNEFLNKIEKAESVEIKYFDGNISIYLNNNRWMYIVVQPEKISLFIYTKLEDDKIKSIKNISKRVKINPGGVNLFIENQAEMRKFLDLIVT